MENTFSINWYLSSSDPLKCEGSHRIHVLGGILFTREGPNYIPVSKTLLSLCFLSKLMKLLVSRQAFTSPGPGPSCPIHTVPETGAQGLS